MLAWEEYTGGQAAAVIGGALFEGLAGSREEAVAKLEAGEIVVGGCHDYGCVGSLAGIYTASMPVFVVENRAFGNTGYCNFYEGTNPRRLNYGVYDDGVRDRLLYIQDTIAPVLAEVVRRSGGIALKPIMKRAVHMSDEMHSRSTAAALIFTRELVPHLLAHAEAHRAGVEKTVEALTEDHYFFLRLSMGAGKAVADAAHGVEGSSVVTAMGFSCKEFGIRVSGLGEQWFCGPHAQVQAKLFDGHTEDEITWMGGESPITETTGLGGFAQAASFPLQAYQGGEPLAMVERNEELYAITVGENSEYRIPFLKYRGTPTGHRRLQGARNRHPALHGYRRRRARRWPDRRRRGARVRGLLRERRRGLPGHVRRLNQGPKEPRLWKRMRRKRMRRKRMRWRPPGGFWTRSPASGSGRDETRAASGLPNVAYTSEEFLELETKLLFARSWMCAGFGHDIPDPGDAIPVTAAGVPVILMRGGDGRVRAFHNVCPHRGTQLLAEPCRGAAALTCPAHGWSYDLSGQVVGKPSFEGPHQHSSERDVCLFPVRSAQWFDVIFVNIDGRAPELADYMAPFTARLEGYDFSTLRYGGTVTYDLASNWKLVHENFIEPYHAVQVHPRLEAWTPATAHRFSHGRGLLHQRRVVRRRRGGPGLGHAAYDAEPERRALPPRHLSPSVSQHQFECLAGSRRGVSAHTAGTGPDRRADRDLFRGRCRGRAGLCGRARGYLRHVAGAQRRRCRHRRASAEGP